MPEISFSSWCLSIDERVRQADPSLEYALDGAHHDFVNGQLVRKAPEILSDVISWSDQGRTVHVMRHVGRRARVESFAPVGPTFQGYEMDIDELTIDPMALNIVTYLKHRHGVDGFQ